MKELAGLNRYFLKYGFRMMWGVLFIILSNWFGVFPAQVIRLAFDLVMDQILVYQLMDGFQYQSLFYKQFTLIVFLFGAIIIGVVVIKGIFMFFMRQTIIVVSRLIEYDLKNAIYAQYQRLNLSFYRQNNTGDLMNRVTEDVSRVRMYIGPAIMYTLNLLVLFILVISTMISVNPTLTWYAIAPLPFLFLAIYVVQNKINVQSELIQEQLSTLSTTIQESFSGIRVIKSYSREASIQQGFNAQSEDYREKSMGLARTQAIFFPTVLVIVGISTILTIYVGGQEVIKGSISAGNIAEFIVYVNMLTWPVASVGWVTSLVQRAAASQKRINEFLQMEPTIASDDKAIKDKIKGEISFVNVSFRYEDTGIQALSHLNFSLKAGQTLAIVGKTGSGKSTLANLLFRMYDVTEGQILIDGIDIRKYDVYSLRRQMSMVPQEVFLFSDTLFHNIAFGVDTATEEQVHWAAKQSCIYDSIVGFEQGFETKLGERGITLSGGQKQRVSIARALLKTPAIMIFDDALSAVDTKTEEQILANLQSIMARHTSIIISHRISTIKHADHIIYLEDGKVIEEGNHAELMHASKAYALLFQQQQLEEEIAVSDV